MPKAKSLIDELKASEPSHRNGVPSWHLKMKSEHPELMKQIDEVIDKWNANDQTLRAKRPTASSLANWLLPRIPVLKNAAQIRRYINERAERGNRR